MSQDSNSSHLPRGVRYFADFISVDEEALVTAWLDSREWSNALKRRVQHFGYRYDYKARTVASDAYLGELPDWLALLGERLVSQGYCEKLPDQVIANEYLPGQGISAHVDCEPCFADAIISISLLSSCQMDFRERRSFEKCDVLLLPRSGILLSGEGRYDWTHEIPARKSDFVGGARVLRGRRISLTFRKVIRTKSL